MTERIASTTPAARSFVGTTIDTLGAASASARYRWRTSRTRCRRLVVEIRRCAREVLMAPSRPRQGADPSSVVSQRRAGDVADRPAVGGWIEAGAGPRVIKPATMEVMAEWAARVSLGVRMIAEILAWRRREGAARFRGPLPGGQSGQRPRPPSFSGSPAD